MMDERSRPWVPAPVAGERATGQRAIGQRATGPGATGQRAIGQRAIGQRATGQRAIGLAARGLAAVGLAMLALTPGPAAAQPAGQVPGQAPAQPPASAPADSVTINLIRLLVEQKVITEQAAAALLAQAQAEASRAQSAAAPALPAAAADVTRVPYVPEIVKSQIRDDVKREVLAEAERSGWATPGRVPGWVERIVISGDVRVRNQSDFYADRNAPDFIDYGEFNAGGPTDINGDTGPFALPLLNTLSDREGRFNFRARLGLDAAITEGVTAGVRIATGSDNSPVSTNTSLGGGLSKRDLWLDRAYITLNPIRYAALTLGRMPNPFFSTELLYDPDLNFDGVALAGDSADLLGETVEVSATAGVFPLEFGSSDAPTEAVFKNADNNKWIFAGQLRGTWEPNERIKVKAGVAYYDFDNVRGRLSEPCGLFSGISSCSTDWTRPSFLQKGNTLFLIRQIVGPPGAPTFEQPQFAGLSMDYNLLNLNAGVTVALSDRLNGWVTGDYVKNLAFDEDDVCRYNPLGLPLTNIELSGGYSNPCAPGPAGELATYRSGDEAWMVLAGVGRQEPDRQGEWNIVASYRRIGPDSMLDAFTDSDFHLGGTNAEGWTLGGTYAVFDRTRFSFRWLSADEVFGQALGIDVLQLDLIVGF